MSRVCCALLITVGALLSACGPASLEDSIAGLQNSYNGKDYGAVVADAGPLLERCASEDASSSSVWRIEKLRLQALGNQGEGTEALAALETLDAAHPGKVNAQLYSQIGTFVMDKENFQGAILILDACKQKYPEMASTFEPLIDDLKARVLSGGTDEDRAALKQLGYL